MTPQEQELITALLNRLKQAAGQPKDAEADALIRRALAEQPDAPYLLVQTVLIQDMTLNNAQHRIADLERQLAEAKSAQPPQQQPQQSTSFLGGLLHGSVPSAGPWGRPAPQAPQPSSGPVWTQSGSGQAGPMASQPPMAPLAAPGASSGFLRQAATTAAGIAGGALLFQGIQSLFGPHYGNMLGGMPMQPGLGETVVNNYYGDQGNAAPGAGAADYSNDPGLGNDPGYVQADDSQYGGQPDFGGQDQGGADQDYGQDQDFGSDQDFGNDDSVDV